MLRLVLEATMADKVLVDKQLPSFVKNVLLVGAAQGSLPGISAKTRELLHDYQVQRSAAVTYSFQHLSR
jgi:hypothetical protein